MKYALIITCEHASNKIPKNYHYLFADADNDLMNTHKAYDIGAHILFKKSDSCFVV